MPERLSSVGLAALREHRKLRAAEFTRALPNHGYYPLVILVSTIVILALILAPALLFASQSLSGTLLLALIGVGILVFGIAASLLALFIMRPFSEGAHGHAAIRGELPQFMAALSNRLGGTYQIAFDLGPTLAFLDTHGLASVPRAALDRLRLLRPERHRIEGSWRGRPVAVEVVIGPPYTPPFWRRASSGDRLGGHIFVFAAGASDARHFESRGVINGLEVFTAFGGVVLMASLRGGLPSPDAVVDALERLGAWQPPQPFVAPDPNAQLPACTTAAAAVEGFLSALRDGAYDRALSYGSPDLGSGQWMEISAPVFEYIIESAGVRPVAWTWTHIAEGALAAELDGVRLRFADGRELPVEIQLVKNDGTYRVSHYAGLGHRRVDPALRSAA